MRRLFFLFVGLGAGAWVGIWAVRKVEQTSRRLRPDALASSASARAGSLGGRLRGAIEEGRRAAAAKEVELRSTYRVDDAPPA
jgi:hypothetical protein